METSHGQCARHVKEILTMFSRIDQNTREQGRTWYQREHRSLVHLARKTHRPVRTVSACLAVLSPRCQWPRAKESLELMLAGHRPTGIFGRSIRKANAILSTTNGIPIDSKTAPKTWAFWRNLWHPSDPEPVTLDSWMFRAHGLPTGSGIRSYQMLANAYRKAAPDLGLIPNQLQAAIWLYVKAR